MILNNKLRIIQLLFLVGLLVLVRTFENQLFYDPLLDFFKKLQAVSVASSSKGILPKLEPMQILWVTNWSKWATNSIYQSQSHLIAWRHCAKRCTTTSLAQHFFDHLLFDICTCLKYRSETSSVFVTSWESIFPAKWRFNMIGKKVEILFSWLSG